MKQNHSEKRLSKFKGTIYRLTHIEGLKRKLCTEINVGELCSIPTQISSKYLPIEKEKAVQIHKINDNTATNSANHFRYRDVVIDSLNNFLLSQSIACESWILLRSFSCNNQMAAGIKKAFVSKHATSIDQMAKIAFTTLSSTSLLSMMKLRRI